MRIIKRSVINEFCAKHADARGSLEAWYGLTKRGKWQCPADIKALFGISVDFVAENRAIFDIKGNAYRLIAEINYKSQNVYIRFLDTHAAYNRVDAATVKKY
jgi:mRNA interferase HigB